MPNTCRASLSDRGATLPARRVQALVLSPTRELAAQTEKNILALGEFLKVQAHCCIGGKSLGARSAHPTSACESS